MTENALYKYFDFVIREKETTEYGDMFIDDSIKKFQRKTFILMYY